MSDEPPAPMEPTLEAALAFLRELGKPKSEGYVWFVNGQAEGWSLNPNPSEFEPGVVFVDVQSGERLVTAGGTAYDGAERLERLPEPGSWEADGIAWWNALTTAQRREAFERAKEILDEEASPADCWWLFGPKDITGEN